MIYPLPGFMDKPSILLASASPRRRELLSLLGFPFTVLSVDVDETIPPNAVPNEIVGLLSRKKAEAALRNDSDHLILAADTVVVLNNDILGKPTDRDDARKMLSRLSDNTHTVYTAFTLISSKTKQSLTEVVSTRVRMRSIASEEIEAYVNDGEPMDKAGAYAIQGKAAIFIEGIEGDYFNVVGLPLFRLSQRLREFGYFPFNG